MNKYLVEQISRHQNQQVIVVHGDQDGDEFDPEDDDAQRRVDAKKLN
jgi:anthranilate phosphoribosyltransferase